MKLILHIGTHKTGTTALQTFLVENSAPLAARGLYYAAPRDETVANSIAHALETGRGDAVRAFFNHHFEEAMYRSAHTVIVSGENFYGMTPLMKKLGRAQPCDGALHREGTLIAQLQTLIPAEATTQIVSYFRRPDHYLESLYNQSIKHDFYVTGKCLDFYEVIADMLSYKKVLDLWREVFGAEFCSTYSYDAVKDDLVPHFMRSVLSIDDLAGFHARGIHRNERISRDFLEYKREKNHDVLPMERGVERKIFARLNEELKLDTNAYRDFLSPEERRDLLESHAADMEGLKAGGDTDFFTPFDYHAAKKDWQPYPGLSPEIRQRIEKEYQRIRNQPGFFMERFARRAAYHMRRRLPVLGVALDAAQKGGLRRVLLSGIEKIQ